MGLRTFYSSFYDWILMWGLHSRVELLSSRCCWYQWCSSCLLEIVCLLLLNLMILTYLSGFQGFWKPCARALIFLFWAENWWWVMWRWMILKLEGLQNGPSPTNLNSEVDSSLLSNRCCRDFSKKCLFRSLWDFQGISWL